MRKANLDKKIRVRLMKRESQKLREAHRQKMGETVSQKKKEYKKY